MGDYKLLFTGYNILGFFRNLRDIHDKPFLDFSSLNHQNIVIYDNLNENTRNNTILLKVGAQEPFKYYFVKQSPSLEYTYCYSHTIEKAFYDTFSIDSSLRDKVDFRLPKRLHYDSNHRLSIYDYDAESETARDYFERTCQSDKFCQDCRVKTFSEKLGKDLRNWHDTFAKEEFFELRNLFDDSLPFGLTIEYALANVFFENNQFSNPKDAVFFQKLRESPELLKSIKKLRDDWHYRAKTILHGDLKPANILIKWEVEGEKIHHLTLIDWEMTHIGDPLWDVAGMVASWVIERNKCFPSLLTEECDSCIGHYLPSYFGSSILAEEEKLVKQYAGVVLLQWLWSNPDTFTEDLFQQIESLFT